MPTTIMKSPGNKCELSICLADMAIGQNIGFATQSDMSSRGKPLRGWGAKLYRIQALIDMHLAGSIGVQVRSSQ